MYVSERFALREDTVAELRQMVPPFGYNGFGEFIFYRTYSRIKEDGSQENWADVIIRVIQGCMSIRKDWYAKNHIEWNEERWQDYAQEMAVSAFKMHWMPPGRGLWAMGSEYIYERGAMALYNCGFSRVDNATFGSDCYWIMDALMNGVGVGFAPIRDDSLRVYMPVDGTTDDHDEVYVIPDTREGWCESVSRLIDSYVKPGGLALRFDYSLIRGEGEPIRGFGGTASGPAPLQKLHDHIREFFSRYVLGQETPAIRAEAGIEGKLRLENYDSVRLKLDVVNAIGCCVVAGNVRRSAEMAVAPINDPVFADLKDYEKNPERADIGWMSNNSVKLTSHEDFGRLGEIAQRVIQRGEPGYLNMVNMKFGRLRVCKDDSEWITRLDEAEGLNPCGEVPLFNKELCNVAETLPTMCETCEEWKKGCEYASFYCSTVSLLPTHSHATNRIGMKNRRIGVSIIDFTGWKQSKGMNNTIRWMREGYKIVRLTNRRANEEAGVPEAIRVTTIKPGGTTPKMAGRTSGIGYPTFHHTVRRVRVAKHKPIAQLLIRANIPYEDDHYSDNTLVFEWPILQGPAKSAAEVTIWEQATNLALVQREWADNAVSNTIYFKPKWLLAKEWGHVPSESEVFHFLVRNIGLPSDECQEKKIVLALSQGLTYESDLILVKRNPEYNTIRLFCFNPHHEEEDIEAVLSFLAPVTKSVSLLPHTSEGVYVQIPESGCTPEEYADRLDKIKAIDWTELSNSDGEDTRYCEAESCEIPTSVLATADEESED
jgi:ribonucleoside-diphosphate reductase alpha chain